jgi:MFS family permease
MKLANEQKQRKSMNSPGSGGYFIIPKMLYFLLNWLVYSPHAFLFQYAGVMWGIDKSFLNLSMSFQIFNFFGAMFWGALADRTKKYKMIAAVSVTVNTAFVCAMAFPQFSGTGRLVYYNFLNAGQCFFSAGTFPMIDAIVLSMLESDPAAGKDYYGSQKAFGTIAHNITAYVLHYAYDHFGEDYYVMYYSAIGSMLALVLTLLFGVSDHLKIKAHKHHGPAGNKAEEVEEEKVPEGSSTVGLLKRPKFFVFLISILAAGIVRSVNTNNHSVYLTDYLKADKSVIGNLMLCGRLAPELGLLFYAKFLMSKMGPYWFLILGQLCGVVRILMYLLLKPFVVTQFPYIGILFLIEALKGANSSMVASDLAPTAWSGAAQTLVGGVWQGISMTVAALIAYTILKVMGDTEENLYYVFLFTGLIGVVSFCFIFFYYSVTDNKLFALKKKN